MLLFDSMENHTLVDKRLLKRRLIGATVLVALGVIFIPMILSGGKDQMPLFGSNIPDKPRAIEQLKSVEIPKPPVVAKREAIRLPVDERLPAASIEKQASREKPDEKPIPQAKPEQTASGRKSWVVQVGSFGKRANALALEKKLRAAKFPAFVEYVKNRDGSVYRVRVGPEVNRDKSEATLQAINKKLKIKGVVLNHP